MCTCLCVRVCVCVRVRVRTCSCVYVRALRCNEWDVHFINPHNSIDLQRQRESEGERLSLSLWEKKREGYNPHGYPQVKEDRWTCGTKHANPMPAKQPTSWWRYKQDSLVANTLFYCACVIDQTTPRPSLRPQHCSNRGRRIPGDIPSVHPEEKERTLGYIQAAKDSWGVPRIVHYAAEDTPGGRHHGGGGGSCILRYLPLFQTI